MNWKEIGGILFCIGIFMLGTLCILHYRDIEDLNGSYMLLAGAAISVIIVCVILFCMIEDIMIRQAKKKKEELSGKNDSDNQRIQPR